MHMRKLAASFALALAALVSADARASDDALRPGASFPAIELDDLLGHTHHTKELNGQRTFVLVMTENGAEDGMRAWGAAADAHLPRGTRRVSIVMVELAFFIPSAVARTQAMSMTPSLYWPDTWFDPHKDSNDASFDHSSTPYAFALDAEGRIVAVLHGLPDEPGARKLWAAFASRDE